jgi:predicted nucleic acid-binding protein
MRHAIVDTNIWIYLLEGRKELSRVKTHIAQGDLVPLLTPVVFAEVLGWQEIGSKEEKKIRTYFDSLEMLTLDMEHWEQIISWRKQGVKKKMPDLLIAAVAKKAGYPVLTRNIRDFNTLDIEVENPWQDEA